MITPGAKVTVRMDDDKLVEGFAISTAYQGTTLLAIGFYSPALGHTNRIDDAIGIEPERIVSASS